MFKKIVVLSVLYSLNVHAQIVPLSELTEPYKLDAVGCNVLQIFGGNLAVSLKPSQAMVELDQKPLSNAENNAMYKPHSTLLIKVDQDSAEYNTIKSFRLSEKDYTRGIPVILPLDKPVECFVDNSLRKIEIDAATALTMNRKDWTKTSSKQKILLLLHAHRCDAGSFLFQLPVEMICEILQYDALDYYRLSSNFTINCGDTSTVRLCNIFNKLTAIARNKSQLALIGTCNVFDLTVLDEPNLGTCQLQ